MKVSLRWMLVILVGILIFLKYLYRGDVDLGVVIFLSTVLLPILIMANIIQIIFSATKSMIFRVCSIFIALGVGSMTFFIMFFAYCWDFDEAIKDHRYEKYEISKDVNLELDIEEAIRSNNKNVTLFVNDKDEKIKIGYFRTNLDLNIKIDKLKTIDGYDLYNIKYKYCYDPKDSKYRDAIFPLVVDKEGQIPYIKNNKKLEEYGLMSQFDMLRYLDNKKLEKDIYLNEINNFTYLDFFASACNNLFDNESMKEIILRSISTNLANGKIPIDEFKYIFSKEIVEAYNEKLKQNSY
ncbi:MAG: hypothetical protein ACRCYE_13935 [Sarcina sp.]